MDDVNYKLKIFNKDKTLFEDISKTEGTNDFEINLPNRDLL